MEFPTGRFCDQSNTPEERRTSWLKTEVSSVLSGPKPAGTTSCRGSGLRTGMGSKRT